jgi:Tfp pilus assembly protein PilX
MGRERGSVTVMGIVMMMLLTSMGTALLLLSKTNLEISANRRDGIAAQYLAEAGVQLAIAKLKTDPNFVNQTETNHSVVTLSFAAARNCTVKTGPALNTTSKNERIIISTGIVNKASRQVIAKVLLPTVDISFTTIWNE